MLTCGVTTRGLAVEPVLHVKVGTPLASNETLVPWQTLLGPLMKTGVGEKRVPDLTALPMQPFASEASSVYDWLICDTSTKFE